MKFALASLALAATTVAATPAIPTGATYFDCLFKGCNPIWVNDGECDRRCFNVQCAWDGNDCGGQPGTPVETPAPTPNPTMTPTETTTPGGGGGNPDVHKFNIEVVYTDNTVSAGIKQAFERASQRWGELISTDLTDITFSAARALPRQCGVTEIRWEAGDSIDDLMIVAKLEPIDGVGQVLGAAGPCAFDNSDMPRVGVMTFDTADLGRMESDGSLENVILHEMGHVIGIGTVWQNTPGLIQGLDGSDPVYTGENGVEGLNLVGGGRQRPKVANTGGRGTRGGHWRESTYGNELMTGYLGTGTSQPLSKLTVSSLKDIGYTVNLDKADPFSLNANRAAMSGMFTKMETGEKYGEDVIEFEDTFKISKNGDFTTRPKPVEAQSQGAADNTAIIATAFALVAVGSVLVVGSVFYVAKNKRSNEGVATKDATSNMELGRPARMGSL